MRRRGGGPASRPIFLFALFFICIVILAGQVSAQEDNAPKPTPDKPDEADEPDEPAPTPPPEEPEDEDDKPKPTDDDAEDDDADAPTEEPTKPPDATKPPETTDAPTAEPTADDEDTEPATLPNLTTEQETPAPTDSNGDRPASLPPLPTETSPIMPPGVEIPTPIIPPTKGAPYLEQSNLPEGTIFIAVGAALGLFALIVVAWRGLVAWSINRSVRRAAANHHKTADAAALLNTKKKKKAKSQQRKTTGTSMSMEKIGNNNRHSGLPARSHAPNPSLFFSPTAGASMNTPGNRGSGYLPAGYYSASGAAPGNGSGLAHHSTSSIGLSPLGPQTQGYARTRSTGPTPPASPGLPPSNHDYEQAHLSTSSLNLSSPPQGRAPSAYLEDLFENHPPRR